ncbi:MAG TPA: hypothetical protein VEX70_05965 [Pyrinomonadaceae bacterium]|nr:hypothetical protein [Pyrinomonadaceae bacterium]
MKKIIIALLFVVVCAPLALADTIYLRDGRTVRGTVLGFIGGRFAVRVATATGGTTTTGTTTEQGEVQFFRPNQIERVEIEGRSLDEARFSSRTVEVGLASNWIDSGVDLRRGERVSVKATGTIVAGRSRITPGGLRSVDPTAPLPRAAEGVLIGAIGNEPDSPIIEIGIGRDFVADRDGRLYLTANRGTFSDARGAYTVQVRTERDLTPRRRDNAASRNTNNDEVENDDDIFDTRRTSPAPVRSRLPGGDNRDNRDNRDTGDAGRVGAPRELSVNVPGTSRDTDSGVELRAGEQVTISASGMVIAGRRIGEVGPQGGRATGFGSIIGTRPVPTAGPGALIGFIRTSNGQISQPFLIGNQLTFNAQVDGRLILAINDDDYSDNGGNFAVRIRVN